MNEAKGRPPAFKFYAKDWLMSRKVRAMNSCQRGMYIMLLANAWDSDDPGVLPDDDDQLWWMAGCRDKEEWMKGGSCLVRGCFTVVHENGSNYLLSERLRLERQKQIEWADKSAEGGAKSGYSRRERSYVTKGGSSLVGVCYEPNVNQPYEREKEKEIRKRTSNKSAENFSFTPPEWVPLETWKAYLQMRLRIKKPATYRAQELAVIELDKLRAMGFPPEAVLNQSILNCWQGVFAIRNGSAKGHGDLRPRPGTPEYNSQLERDMEAATKEIEAEDNAKRSFSSHH